MSDDEGLFPIIESTFAAYGQGNVNDPMENAKAAKRYTEARYGSMADWGKPGGYERAAMSVPAMRVRRCWDCGRVHRWCWLVGKVRRRLGLKW